MVVTDADKTRYTVKKGSDSPVHGGGALEIGVRSARLATFIFLGKFASIIARGIMPPLTSSSILPSCQALPTKNIPAPSPAAPSLLSCCL